MHFITSSQSETCSDTNWKYYILYSLSPRLSLSRHVSGNGVRAYKAARKQAQVSTFIYSVTIMSNGKKTQNKHTQKRKHSQKYKTGNSKENVHLYRKREKNNHNEVEQKKNTEHK